MSLNAMMVPPKAPKTDQVSRFFYFLFTANILMYMEAGAVPASLLPLASSFSMSLSEQGLLGGIVFLSIAFAGPFAGYFLWHYEHRHVLGFSLALFNALLIFWALFPADWPLSSSLFIFIRFLMGLCQCVCCVFFPLWTNDYAPRHKMASWMSMLQASVPFGVMLGYIAASIILRFSNDQDECLFGLYCWRLPLLLEGFLMLPVAVSVFFIPHKLITVRMAVKSSVHKEIDVATHGHSSYGSADNQSYGSALAERVNGRNRWYSDDETSSGISMVGGKPATMTPMRMKRRRSMREDQRRSYRRLRQSSMAASLYDSMSARDVLRQSYSTLAILDSKDDTVLGMISSGGLHWVESNEDANKAAEEEYDADNLDAIEEEDILDDVKKHAYMQHLSMWEDKLKDFFKNDKEVDSNDRFKPPASSMSRSWSMPVVRTEGVNNSSETENLLQESPRSSRSSSCDSEPGSVENDGNSVDSSAISLCQALLILAKMPVYRSVVLSMAALYFVVTGVQFWGTSYMIIALKTPVLMVQCFFIFVAATAPTSGVIFGGWYLDSKGGYKGAKQRYIALKICVAFGGFGLFWTILTIFTTNFYLVVLYIWLILFSGGATLPGCSGIAISVVPRAYRTYSSSISLIIFNLFGYFLSVALSGVLMQIVTAVYPWCDQVCSRTFGFRLILLWSVWSIIFLIIAVRAAKQAYHRKKEVRRKKSLDDFNKLFQNIPEQSDA